MAGEQREMQNALDRASLYNRDGVIEAIDEGAPRPSPVGATGVMGALRAAAVSYVEALPTHPKPRGIELASGFRGVVQSQALAACGDRDAAMITRGRRRCWRITTTTG